MTCPGLTVSAVVLLLQGTHLELCCSSVQANLESPGRVTRLGLMQCQLCYMRQNGVAGAAEHHLGFADWRGKVL